MFSIRTKLLLLILPVTLLMLAGLGYFNYLNQVEAATRQVLEALGGQEVDLPRVQPADLVPADVDLRRIAGPLAGPGGPAGRLCRCWLGELRLLQLLCLPAGFLSQDLVRGEELDEASVLPQVPGDRPHGDEFL